MLLPFKRFADRYRKSSKIGKLRFMASCIVTYVDADGLLHTVEVQAASLYEAAALSISSFRKHNIFPAGLAELKVEIRSSIVHTVTVKQLENWLKTTPRTPKEMAAKEKLRALI